LPKRAPPPTSARLANAPPVKCVDHFSQTFWNPAGACIELKRLCCPVSQETGLFRGANLAETVHASLILFKDVFDAALILLALTRPAFTQLAKHVVIRVALWLLATALCGVRPARSSWSIDGSTPVLLAAAHDLFKDLAKRVVAKWIVAACVSGWRPRG
jgi:hypothetical protein